MGERPCRITFPRWYIVRQGCSLARSLVITPLCIPISYLALWSWLIHIESDLDVFATGDGNITLCTCHCDRFPTRRKTKLLIQIDHDDQLIALDVHLYIFHEIPSFLYCDSCGCFAAHISKRIYTRKGTTKPYKIEYIPCVPTRE